VIVELPANAHLASSGNDWVCDNGYRRQHDGCIPDEG